MTVPAPSKLFVSYLRVSSRAQGQSGLGLDAQRADVSRYVESHGGELLREFVEVESGKKNTRPELMAALQFARRARATLVVAKLDRLSRNVAFLATLMESSVEFVAVDNPHATRFTIHILAAVAEFEREMIVKRTRAALDQARERGILLGSQRPGHWDGREDRRLEGARRGAAKAAEMHRSGADAACRDIGPIIAQLRSEGLSLRQIAARLNESRLTTRRGCQWTAHAVRAILLRGTDCRSEGDGTQQFEETR